MRPEVASATVRGHGEVVIKPDGHSDGFGVRLRFIQLFFENELRVLVICDGSAVLLSEIVASVGIGSLKLGRPVEPGPAVAILFVEDLIQGAVEGVFLQQVAFAFAEVGEGKSAGWVGGTFEFAVEHFQKAQFQDVDVVIGDKFGIARGFYAGLNFF